MSQALLDKTLSAGPKVRDFTDLLAWKAARALRAGIYKIHFLFSIFYGEALFLINVHRMHKCVVIHRMILRDLALQKSDVS